MPKLVDYSDRFEALREAVYVVTLRDGVEGINLAAVATEVYMSARTVQRLLGSAKALPLLGLQWAERKARRRAFDLHRQERTGGTPQSDLDAILETLPGHPEREDRTVWWRIVTAFEGSRDWARTARADQLTGLAHGCETIMATLDAEDRPFEARRLELLLTGAGHQISSGRLSYEEAESVVARHVRAVGGSVAASSHTCHGGATSAA